MNGLGPVHHVGRKMESVAFSRLMSVRYGHCSSEWHMSTSHAMVLSASIENSTYVGRPSKGGGHVRLVRHTLHYTSAYAQ